MKPQLPLLVGVALVAVGTVRAADPIEFKDGDRVVMLGNTLIEREQRTGYWETLLTVRHPLKNITFRNLGWSGDTVWGDARARFGGRADGFKHLKTHVLDLKPTVIIVGYGTNESFAGKEGLPQFEAGLKTLLDTLDETKARIILLAPLKHEKLAPPLPDPAAANANLALYRDAMKKTAEKRGYGFIDMYALLDRDAGFKCASMLTDNGMHLTDFGYWRAVSAIEASLSKPEKWDIKLDVEGKSSATGVKLSNVKRGPLAFDMEMSRLPLPLAPTNEGRETTLPGDERTLTLSGLAPGKYTLKIDGKATITATAEQWHKGVALNVGPDFEQVEKLREQIREKNRLYFHRWRPQNETYLFGFRKKEQGRNAVEIPQFDPLIEKSEKEIAKLRVPVSHHYELLQEGK